MNNTHKWIKEALNKFDSFRSRSPIIMNAIKGYKDNKSGLFVIVNNHSNFFAYDFDITPKEWIYRIRLWVSYYYPKLSNGLRLEKVLLKRRIFILHNEELHTMTRYFYNGSLTQCLTLYHSGKTDIEALSLMLYKNSIKLDNIRIKEIA